MTTEQALKKITDEGNARIIDDMFQVLYRNICDTYGGEDKIDGFHLANIRGSLTRAKTFALVPTKETPNGQEDQQPDNRPDTSFRI